MANTLTLAQLQSYQELLNVGEIATFYSVLLSEGYMYAGWARGVANAYTTAGISALDFLNDSAAAMLGLDGNEVKALDAATRGCSKFCVTT